MREYGFSLTRIRPSLYGRIRVKKTRILTNFMQCRISLIVIIYKLVINKMQHLRSEISTDLHFYSNFYLLVIFARLLSNNLRFSGVNSSRKHFVLR